MKILIKAALGLSVAALFCAIPEWLAPLMTPGCTWLLMAALPAGLAAYVWHWCRKTVEEGEGNADAGTTDCS